MVQTQVFLAAHYDEKTNRGSSRDSKQFEGKKEEM